jgi:hypothetical protein
MQFCVASIHSVHDADIFAGSNTIHPFTIGKTGGTIRLFPATFRWIEQNALKSYKKPGNKSFHTICSLQSMRKLQNTVISFHKSTRYPAPFSLVSFLNTLQCPLSFYVGLLRAVISIFFRAVSARPPGSICTSARQHFRKSIRLQSGFAPHSQTVPHNALGCHITSGTDLW